MSRLSPLGAALCIASLSVPACLLIGDGQLDPGAGSGGDMSSSSSFMPMGGGPAGGSPNAGGGGDGGSGGSTTSGGGTGGEMCDTGEQCVPDISAGSYVRSAPGSAICDAGWGNPIRYSTPSDPGCIACTCDLPPQGTCTMGTFTAYEFFDCTGSTASTTMPGCIDYTFTWSAYRLSPSTPSVQSCAPIGGGEIPLVDSTVCSPTIAVTKGCGGGNVCVPAGAATLCNLLPAGSPCPTGYGNPVTVAPVVSDTRDCACTCGLSTGQDCNGTATINSNNDCTGLIGVVPDNNNCTDLNNTNGSGLPSAGTWSGGTCLPDPQTGSVTFGVTETLCCLL